MVLILPRYQPRRADRKVLGYPQHGVEFGASSFLPFGRVRLAYAERHANGGRGSVFAFTNLFKGFVEQLVISFRLI